MLTYKRANSGVKIIIVRARPDRNHDISCFPIGPKANWDRGCYALSKALIAFRFCTRIGPTEAHVLPCAPARNNVSIPSYRGAESSRRPNVTRLPSSELLFSSCPHWHQFVVRRRLQMVKISKLSIRKLKSYEH